MRSIGIKQARTLGYRCLIKDRFVAKTASSGSLCNRQGQADPVTLRLGDVNIEISIDDCGCPVSNATFNLSHELWKAKIISPGFCAPAYQ